MSTLLPRKKTKLIRIITVLEIARRSGEIMVVEDEEDWIHKIVINSLTKQWSLPPPTTNETIILKTIATEPRINATIYKCLHLWKAQNIEGRNTRKNKMNVWGDIY